MGESRGAKTVLVGNLRGGDYLKKPDLVGRIILK
jgi:hypothetical protein